VLWSEVKNSAYIILHGMAVVVFKLGVLHCNLMSASQVERILIFNLAGI
jgi:hypothetical protein